MRYSGIQPQYFPRLHYIARIIATDIYMIRDDAQYVAKHKYPGNRVDKSYQSHTPIKEAAGRQFMTIPIEHGGPHALFETHISYSDHWVQDHLKALQFAYGRALNFSVLLPQIENILSVVYPSLADLNTATILWSLQQLLGKSKVIPKIGTLQSMNRLLSKQTIFRLKKIKRASEVETLHKDQKLSPNEKIIALCKGVGATEDYCGGTGVQAYVEAELFKKNGITITVQDWKCQPYAQQFMKQGFIPNLSIIDILMNVPSDVAVSILKG